MPAGKWHRLSAGQLASKKPVCGNTATATYLAFNLSIKQASRKIEEKNKTLVDWRRLVEISLHKIDHGSCNLQHGTLQCARASTRVFQCHDPTEHVYKRFYSQAFWFMMTRYMTRSGLLDRNILQGWLASETFENWKTQKHNN